MKGITIGGEAGQSRMVYACQARVLSDLHVEFDKVPPPLHVNAIVEDVAELAADVVEVSIKPLAPIDPLPGQYCRFAFRGFPSRAYSPTLELRRSRQSGTFGLHVKRVKGGRVSSELGRAIRPGHRLWIDGPFGTAFHRRGRKERLVLASSGTGFAPMFAVADAALMENYHRPMVLVAGARRLDQLYMPSALGRLSAAPNVTIIATAEEPQSESRLVRVGGVTDHLPAFCRATLSSWPAHQILCERCRVWPMRREPKFISTYSRQVARDRMAAV
jgi:3-phenylpropionate/trans-cinnamate dioxygenase ferredoxin reductase subunit